LKNLRKILDEKKCGQGRRKDDNGSKRGEGVTPGGARGLCPKNGGMWSKHHQDRNFVDGPCRLSLEENKIIEKRRTFGRPSSPHP